MSETPWERYCRREREEIIPLENKLNEKSQELKDELVEARKTCEHTDHGGLLEGYCVKCLTSFG